MRKDVPGIPAESGREFRTVGQGAAKTAGTDVSKVAHPGVDCHDLTG
ncbi:MAG: hypothetical protein JNL58_06990 [Planctomyces sp.]|nr:hypothetical protein [Planctomyces sp.]